MDQPPAILIVEDRSIVAAKIRRELEGAGYAVAGPAATPSLALAMADRRPLRGAVLDVDLRGRPVYPVAEVLRRRGVPFLFLTGYSHAAIPPPWQDVPLVEKPFEAHTLLRVLGATLAGIPGEPGDALVASPTIRRAWEVMRHRRDLVTEQRAWSEDHQAGRHVK